LEDRLPAPEGLALASSLGFLELTGTGNPGRLVVRAIARKEKTK